MVKLIAENLWARQQRKKLVQENPGVPQNEISKRLGVQWRELPESDKAKYMEEADTRRKANVENEPAYMLWASKLREKVKQENPRVHHQTIDRILVKQWQALSEFDKKPYVEEAEMHDMQLDTRDPEGEIRRAFKLNMQKEVHGPGYNLWAKQQRKKVTQDNPFIHNHGIDRILAKTWKALSDTDKKVYVEEAEMRRVAYENHKAAGEDKADTTIVHRAAYILWAKQHRRKLAQESPGRRIHSNEIGRHPLMMSTIFLYF